MLRVTRFILLSLFVLASVSSNASDLEPEMTVVTINTDINQIEAAIEDQQFLLENLDNYLERLPEYVSWAKECIEDSTSRLTKIVGGIKELGFSAAGEPEDVILTREKLNADKNSLDSDLAGCKAILVRSKAAIKEISIFRKENLQRQSLEQGRNIVTVINEAVTESHQWVYALGGMLVSAEGIHALTASELIMLFSIIAFSLMVGFQIRRSLGRWDSEKLARVQKTALDKGDTGKRVISALAMTTRRYIAPFLVSFSTGLFLYIETFNIVPKPLITIVMDGLPLLALAFSLTYFVFKALFVMGLRSDIEPATALALRRRFNILALFWFLGYLLFQTILANSLSEAAFFLARAIIGVIIILNVIWIIWLTRSNGEGGLNPSVRIVVSLLLLGVLIAELTGYRNLSGYVLRGVVGSLIAYGLFRIISNLLRSFLYEFDRGQSSWQQRIRRAIGVSSGEQISGLFWVRIIAFISVWLLFVAALLIVWEVPEAEIKLVGSYITQGFTVGSIEIVPLKIFEAIIVLILMLAVNGWFQQRFGKTWLGMTSLDRGARESIATVANYVGIGIAIVVAFAIAGMDFSKLAIIAGALSVGIGFGLQNIVNNFVSGLILLFERPIKTGDWITAGTVEGNVKKIRIRSTQIESFDRADIIVPNSELVTSNLTNWVHKDRRGRVCIPIGVAYGSNTERVRNLLIEIARNHSDVVVGNMDLHDPKVIFLAFGESSLDLELRFFVKDIKKRIDILSDINFAIDKVFRENSIEIPFPQRDIHIRGAGTEVPEAVDPKEH